MCRAFAAAAESGRGLAPAGRTWHLGGVQAGARAQRELATGLSRYGGTEVDGRLAIGEEALNDALAHSGKLPAGVRLELGADNRLALRYGVLHASATLAAAVDLGASIRIRLQVSSAMIAWSIRQALHVPHVTIDGREITIDVGAMDPVTHWRAAWRHLRSATLATEPGRLVLQFRFAIP